MERGWDLTKFLKANKTKKEENIRKINNFFGHSKNIWGIGTFCLFDFPYFFPLCQANKVAKTLFSLPSLKCSVFTKGQHSYCFGLKRLSLV